MPDLLATAKTEEMIGRDGRGSTRRLRASLAAIGAGTYLGINERSALDALVADRSPPTRC